MLHCIAMEFDACWRSTVFGAVTGGIVGGASAAVDAFTAITRAATTKAGPQGQAARANLQGAALRAVALRSAGGAGAFAIYQTGKCALAATADSHGLPELAQLGLAATGCLVPAALASLRGVPVIQVASLLVLMDNARLFLPASE